MSAASANGPTNGAANGPKNGPESEPTKETMLPHMTLMVEKLQSRMMKLIHVMTEMDHAIAKRTQGSNQTHRVQTLRRGRVINKKRHTMKKMKRLHMIFKHDVNLLLRRYTTLFKQATQVLTYLRSESVPTPLPSGVIADANSLAEFYVRYNQLYHKIHEENEALHRMLRGENADSNENITNNDESLPNNEESSPNIRFGPSSFHDIPHRMDAESMYLPAATTASSSGGKRKRKCTLRKKRGLRKRTLRKKHNRA